MDQLVAELLSRFAIVGLFLGGFIGKADIALRLRQQNVEDAIVRRIFSQGSDPGHGLLASHLDRGVDQVTDNRFHIFADITHLGELGRLDLDERRIGQMRQAAGDLGFADTGRADHQDVFGRDFDPHIFIHLHPAPAVAQGDGHGALGVRLADNVFVQFLDNFAWCHL